MRRVTGATKYFNFAELENDTLLVDGEYIGQIDGKFGPQHEFKEPDGTLVVIGGGHLNYLVEKYLSEGDRCRVIFEGMDTLEGGKYAGKEVKKFALELPDEEEAPKVAKATPKKEDAAPWDGEKEPSPRKKVVKRKKKAVVEEEDDDDDDDDAAMLGGGL